MKTQKSLVLERYLGLTELWVLFLLCEVRIYSLHRDGDTGSLLYLISETQAREIFISSSLAEMNSISLRPASTNTSTSRDNAEVKSCHNY